MSVEKAAFGVTAEGKPCSLYRITNARGAYAEMLGYGCTLRSLVVPDRAGRMTDVVLGYDTLREYEKNGGFLGAVVGRYANRIGNASFPLNGKTYALAANNGKHSIHGGKRGFDKYVWEAETSADAVTFSRRSPDGEEGYPGNLAVRVTYALSEDNALTITYEAETDADTVLNLTNHAYFNLAGAGSGTVFNHMLTVFADAFTENGAGCLPTGRLLDVAGTPFDFRSPKPIGRDIDADDPQLAAGHGYDHNFAIGAEGEEKRAAVLLCPENGVCMTVTTTMPGMQVYTANGLSVTGKHGAVYGKRDAVCLETQQYPDAPNRPAFPSAVLRAGERAFSRTTFAFSHGA